jgi:hypothetical protein
MTIGYEFETTPAAYAGREPEAFFENVAAAARSGRRYRPLALLAMKAARAALSEGTGKKKGNGEAELELESEGEGEWETSPAHYREAFSNGEAAPSATLMEHLGHAAAEAESNGEAFAFLAPLLPLALKALPLATKALGMGTKLLPKVASTVARSAPKIIRGLNGAAKTLRANPVTRPLIRSLPQVVRRTTADLAKQIASGAPVTPQTAVRTLAKQTAQVIGDPKTALNSIQRSLAVDGCFHKAVAAAPRVPIAKPCRCR